MTSISSILIIGAGQAAAVAAAALRDQGYTGRITVVGNEAHAPYERPPLSKSVLAAIDTPEPAIAVKTPDFFDSQQVDLRLGTEVSAIDAQARQAVLADGSRLDYDRCLLATGGAARILPGFPVSSPAVHYLRTLDDARALRSRFQQGQHIAVVGGGFLGLEIASTARSLGVDVSIIETAPRVLARVVPPVFSTWMQERITQSGAALHTGQAISAIHLPDTATLPARLSLANGTQLEAALVVVAIGLTPNTQLAYSAGLQIDASNGGIAVDAQCRSSDPYIYAAGDCTSQTRADTPLPLRLESWQNANEQARIAASSMLGRDTEAAAYPWFWTDQFDCNIQMLGLPRPDLNYVVRGSMDPASAAPRFIMLGLHDGKPYQALAVNAGGDLRALRPLLERALPIDAAQFSDETITVRAFAKAAQAQAATPG
jgi:3-phenylpropionate/trans-cinnamate dioxygenase ferredoxin reductase subunit